MKVLKISDLADDFQTILIYAPPKTGKTTMLGYLEGKTLIIDVDKGTSVLKGNKNDIKIIRLDEDLKELPQIIDQLEKKCDYDNVVIDGLSELEKAMLTIYGRLGKNDGAPEQSHYNKVQFKIIDYCRRFRSLKANIIFTAWEQQVEYISSDGSKFTKAKPLLSGKTSETVCGLCDVVGHLEISNKEDSKNKRYIRLEGTETVIAGDRINKRTYCEIEDLIK